MDAKIQWKTDPAVSVPNLKFSLQKRSIQRAIKQSLPPVVEAVRSNAEAIEDTGTLAQSIGMRTKVYREAVIGVVGARTKFQKTFGSFTRGKHKGEPRIKKPSKYSHLIERGTKRSRATPFLKPALDQTSGTYLASVQEKIGDEINKELAKNR